MPLGVPFARELGTEGIEFRLPESSEPVEPGVGLSQGSRIHRIQPSRAVRAHRRESSVAKHTEVLRDRGLRNAELRLDDAAQLAGRFLAIDKELEDPAPDRITEDVKRVHDSTLASKLI